MKYAKRLYPRLDVSRRTEWLGFRPSIPDSLPVIGASPRHTNAFLAFGHGHIGHDGCGDRDRAAQHTGQTYVGAW